MRGNQNYRDAVADIFRAQPNTWISAYTLMDVGGKLAFRTRVSDCRRQLGMTIENRVERDRYGVAQSYYKFVSDPQAQRYVRSA